MRRSWSGGGMAPDSMLVEWVLVRAVLLVFLGAVASTVSVGREALAGQFVDRLAEVDPTMSDDPPRLGPQYGSDVRRGSMPEASNARLMSTWQARPVFSM